MNKYEAQSKYRKTEKGRRQKIGVDVKPEVKEAFVEALKILDLKQADVLNDAILEVINRAAIEKENKINKNKDLIR